MWRTVGDFWDSWLQLKEHFGAFERWNQYRTAGAWPDGDMLPLGHIGIRAERGIKRMTNFTKEEQQTLMTLWAIFRSPLMFGGNLPDNDSFTLALLTNKEVLNVLNNSSNNRQLVKTKSSAAWMAEDVATGDKYVAVFNFADRETAVESKAVAASKIISRSAVLQSENISVDITGAKKLYLVVTDGGDNTDWDHADWINPALYNGSDSLPLTALKWKRASAGWGNVQINKAVSGNGLKVNGIAYSTGIGTHSNSVIEFDLPPGYTSFKSLVGLDEAAAVQNAGATFRFLVFTSDPAGPAVPDKEKIPVDLKQLGFNADVAIKDLWTGKNLGTFSNSFEPLIGQHGCGLYRISKK